MAQMPWYGGQLGKEEEEEQDAPNLGQSQQPVEPGTPANVKPGSSISAMLSNPLMQQMMDEIQAGLGAEQPADPKISLGRKLATPGYFTDPSIREGIGRRLLASHRSIGSLLHSRPAYPRRCGALQRCADRTRRF